MPRYIKNLNKRTKIACISVLSAIVIALMGLVVFSQVGDKPASATKSAPVTTEAPEAQTMQTSQQTTKAPSSKDKTETNTSEKELSQSSEPATEVPAVIAQGGGGSTNTAQSVQQHTTEPVTQSSPQNTAANNSLQSTRPAAKQPQEKEFEVGYNLIHNMLTHADKSEKEVLLTILNGIENRKRKINISDGVIRKNDTEKLSDMFLLIKAALAKTDTLGTTYTYYGDYYITSLELNYALSQNEIDAQRSQLKSKVNRVMSHLDSSMSDFDKVLYFHDEIASYCKYTSSGKNVNSAYGCLVEGKASCEGYAKAFLELCDAAKIDCMIVTGKATANGKTVPHMWNKVKVSGRWYNIDVCWDDPTTDGSGIILYDYLNVTDEDILKAHEPEENRFYSYPEAYSDDENYFVKNDLIINSESETQDTIKSAVEKALRENKRFASVRFSDKSVFEYSSNMFSNSDSNNVIFDILHSAFADTKIPFDTGSVTRAQNDELLTMTFILSY